MAKMIQMKNPETGLTWNAVPPLKGFHFFRFIQYVRFWFVPLLLLRGYRFWGAIGITLWVVLFGIVIISDDYKTLALIPVILYFSLGIFFGPKIPKLAVESKLRNGWVFADPDSEQTKEARAIWNV